ncbi:hypothetical protein L249_7620 [Ophiocordyceps polyrhachis-furcata BCC 54312]|uniref:ABM domain-containing protein n=1 Tax=Ophiocordyceps polyrhachis-furcata BCC 54312 TaxID=1330021 RepID=A0A367LA88_9HYPO|nr:hypothetical protein L249_7620 [Ophiocordyceps polyrhachis-furcata BCC 54312]
MTVTEFAVLKLQDNLDDQRLQEVLIRCSQRQRGWAQLNQGNSDIFSNIYLGHVKTSPAVIITAPWDSPEAHAEWIRTDENQACNRELAEFVRSVELCHLEPPAGGRQKALRGPFRPLGVPFGVHQLSVPSHRRHGVDEAYRALQADLSCDDDMWAGWRVEEGDDGHHQSLVVFWSDDVGEEQQQRLIGTCQVAQHGSFRCVV